MKLTKIQKSAKNEHCTVMMLGCRDDTETTVLAHKTYPIYPNSPRRCDARAAYACVHCHDILDGRIPVFDWDPYEKDAIWAAAIERTHVKLIEKGLMTFIGLEFVQKLLPRR